MKRETGVAKKTGNTRQYYVPAHANPTRQSNDLAYRHYFMALPFREEKIGAIVSGIDGNVVPTSVVVEPATQSTAQDSTVNFTATVNPAGASQDVTWSIDTASGLSIDQSGEVTVGAGTPAGEYTVTATSQNAPNVSGTATLTVED